MKNIFQFLSFTLILSGFTPLLAQQIEIPRVSQMPDLPATYEMRNWKEVAVKYNQLVFDVNKSGDHFPIVSLGATGVNYPEIQPIFMDSYVGSSSHGQQREAVSIIPALVGASLAGVDKTDDFGTDWVTKIKDFYNLKNNELVYLNGPSDHSGHDWWYETMPNVFFYQLYDLYPETAGFETHFTTVADRWLTAVEAMGASDAPWAVPSMNYRAWSLTDMQPLTSGVKEPEAAGAIAWILYQAYQHTGESKYLKGAEWALDYLNSLTENPSYELQLPYGVLTAARMNAEIGTDYDIEKMLNWCFNRGNLRGWGSVVGNWGGQDVSGLIGEANDQGNDYVFLMNGFQQAAALAPLVKYDKRFAKAILKWILNVSNASRLFYSPFLPESQQSDFSWCQTNDPDGVIAYEAIKENWNSTALYARGDSKSAGWAQTNLGIYGSSHVGYLGGILQTTDVEGVLQIDLNKTDFYADNAYPTFGYYNPHATPKNITIQLGADAQDLYDAISEQWIKTNVSGSQTIEIPAKDVILLTIVPTGTETHLISEQLISNSGVIDYHSGYHFNPSLRIRTLAAAKSKIETGQTASVYCTAAGEGDLTYDWWINGELVEENTSILTFTPSVLGAVKVKVVVSDGEISVTDSVALEAVALIPESPEIQGFSSEKMWFESTETMEVTASVTDPKGLDLTYSWQVENGILVSENGKVAVIKAVENGVTKVIFSASNYELTSSATYELLIVNQEILDDPLLQLSMNQTTDDQSANHFKTSLAAGVFVDGPVEESHEALKLSSATHELYVSNNNALNFRDEIGISLWVYFTNFSEERFVISHGSWEKRWKLSTTVDKKLRWTVNTTDGIKDLDSQNEVVAGQWYHVIANYDGHSLQLFLDGSLNAFTAHTGQINTSDVGITVGKRLAGDTQYDLKGTIDEVRIYDQSIDPEQAATLMNVWSPVVISSADPLSFLVYPNPGFDELKLNDVYFQKLELYNLSGEKLLEHHFAEKSTNIVSISAGQLKSGIYLVMIDGKLAGKWIKQ